MPAGRTDSDLDDVWSDESGEIDRAGELTEFDFNPPKKKEAPKQELPKKEVPTPRPPLISDLDVPVLGLPVEPKPTLEIGSVLVGSSSSVLLDDMRETMPEPAPKETRTMISDAEGAAIARAVSRSLLTSAEPVVAIPPMLARDEVKKVVMGKEEEPPSSPPNPPPPPPAPEDLADDLEPATDPPLELAFDPRQPQKAPLPRPSPPPPSRAFPIRGIVIAMLLIMIAAFVIRVIATHA